MKIGGKTLPAPKRETIVIPRGDEGDFVFYAKPVLDFSRFEALCPEPKPPSIIFRGEKKAKPDLTDEDYRAEVEKWSSRRIAWMVLESLDAEDGLEWETVDRTDPETWDGWTKELETSGLLPVEVNRIFQKIIEVCGLSSEKIDEATRNFLASQGQEAASH